MTFSKQCPTCYSTEVDFDDESETSVCYECGEYWEPLIRGNSEAGSQLEDEKPLTQKEKYQEALDTISRCIDCDPYYDPKS